MPPPIRTDSKFAALRRQAEALLELSEADPTQIDLETIRHLMHELSVHQIELEMQNDELIRSQNDLHISHSRYYQLFNLAPLAYAELDGRGIIRNCNQALTALTRFDGDKLLGKTLVELVHPEDRLIFDIFFKHAANGPKSVEFRLIDQTGSILFVRLAARWLNPAHMGDDAALLVALSDETARKEAEEKLKLSAAVFDSSSEGVIITDEKNRIISVNQAFTQITGYSLDEVLGKNPKVLNSARQDPHFFRQFWKCIVQHGSWEGEIWNRRKNGEVYPEWLSINVLRDVSGKIYRHIGVFSDITERNRTQEIIRKQANYDYLTGLPNRVLFQDRLEYSLRHAHRSGLSLALLFLDVDRFKEINDTLGHSAGDELLKELARRLQSCVRDSDTVARPGGDEFIVILNELDEPSSVDRVANLMLEQLAQPVFLNGEQVYVTASIGIAFYPTDTTNMEDLIKSADQAMYVSKRQGRNRFTFFTPSMQEAAKIRRQIAGSLRTALLEQQFHVHYQPIVSLASGEIHKAEALIRWLHPEGKMISPAAFIPIAEETGQIVDIGNWVFHQVVETVQRWRAHYDPAFQISLNKSPAQFSGDANCRAMWLQHLHQNNLPGNCIIIEVTEGLLLDADNNKVSETMRVLRDAGFETALDDFGTGYSSLSYLQKFGIDYIKIDQSFVCNLGNDDGQSLALCAAIVEMAHKLGMRVVAEGIETSLQRDLLINIGCDFGQGYLFARPASAETFENLLQAASVYG